MALASLVVVGLLAYLVTIFNMDQTKDNLALTNAAFVVRILNTDGTSGGTGFLLRVPGGRSMLLTNKHVCGLADKDGRIVALTADGYYYNTTVLAQSTEDDLCFLNTPPTSGGLELASDVSDGQRVYILGHGLLEPIALAQGNLGGELFLELVVSVNQPCIQGQTEIDPGELGEFFGIENFCAQRFLSQMVTATTLPGNSGSPVLSETGSVVGIVFAGLDTGVRGYMVPSRRIEKFINETFKETK